jgi:hypothetical protein
VARNLKTKALSVAALGFGALCLLATASLAAPPPGRQASHASNQFQAPAQQLDLRAPSHAVDAGNVAENSAGAFPSRAHRQTLAQEPLELPLLGSDSMRARPTMQDFVQRVHQQGLPVARLIETKSALLHLGLNARGKPGLWLVQKTH